ncbi:heptaprenyl diphosphate synthase component 1 [Alkalicoccus urumqiensis]|nr:heptaprenyl diphosphate synthase component 1 [Alkalicoccus urumqiensis]
MTATYDNLHTIHTLTTEFYKSVRQPYVQRYLPEPALNPMQAGLLLTLLEQSDETFTEESKRAAVLAALLVQAAMDAHDRIGAGPVFSESERKQRQLTVLAGDYYSSLYYSILAQHGETALLKVLSRAVQKINMEKMRAYRAENEEERLYHLIEAKNMLTSEVALHLGLPESGAGMKQLFFLQYLVEYPEASGGRTKEKLVEAAETIHSLRADTWKLQQVMEREASRLLSAYENRGV